MIINPESLRVDCILSKIPEGPVASPTQPTNLAGLVTEPLLSPWTISSLPSDLETCHIDGRPEAKLKLSSKELFGIGYGSAATNGIVTAFSLPVHCLR
jgi:hypothetical protein